MLDLNELADGLPAITPSFGRYLAEAGAVCLESQGHQQGQSLILQGDQSLQYALKWPTVNDQMQRSLNDQEEATEFGATGIAVLLAKKVVGYAVVERSRKGTGFDYWLGDESLIPFQNKARLEISGIRKGNAETVRSRVRTKLKQTGPSDQTGLPAYVMVIEFSQPLVDMRKK